MPYPHTIKAMTMHRLKHNPLSMLTTALALNLLLAVPSWAEVTKVPVAVELFGQAWNEPDEKKREQLINDSWAKDGIYLDPTTEIHGRENLLPMLTHYFSTYPNAKVIQTSNYDQHHSIYRVSWKVILENGEQLVEGTDVGQLNKDGKLVRLNSFFGPLVPLEK